MHIAYMAWRRSHEVPKLFVAFRIEIPSCGNILKTSFFCRRHSPSPSPSPFLSHFALYIIPVCECMSKCLCLYLQFHLPCLATPIKFKHIISAHIIFQWHMCVWCVHTVHIIRSLARSSSRCVGRLTTCLSMHTTIWNDKHLVLNAA